MEEKTFVKTLSDLFAQNGQTRHLSHARSEAFFQLTGRLLAENEKYNLTAVTDARDVILLHYIDSLTVEPYLPRDARVIDVGTGAGFPALPLALVRPDLSVLAADATEKRVAYVAETARLLGLSNLTAETLRAETAGRDKALRERFDAAVARGVAALRVLCEYCLPFVRVGGVLLAMKGPSAAIEARDARRAVAMLGAKIEKIVPTPLHGAEKTIDHTLVVIKKIAPTPAAYPRDNSQITRHPL